MISEHALFKVLHLRHLLEYSLLLTEEERLLFRKEFDIPYYQKGADPFNRDVIVEAIENEKSPLYDISVELRTGNESIKISDDDMLQLSKIIDFCNTKSPTFKPALIYLLLSDVAIDDIRFKAKL